MRHATTEVKLDHYEPVAAALLPVIKDVLGDAVDDWGAWGEAYWFLADILVGRTTKLRLVPAQTARAEDGCR